MANYHGSQVKVVCEEICAREYRECAAKTNEGVKEVFEVATRNALLARNALLTQRRRKGRCLIL